MNVLIPSPLLSYTGKKEVSAAGATVGALMADLDRQFPGIRFRMVDEQDHFRPHMRLFVNGEQTFDMGKALKSGDEIAIVQALSGG